MLFSLFGQGRSIRRDSGTSIGVKGSLSGHGSTPDGIHQRVDWIFPEQKAFADGGYEPSNARMAPNAERIYRWEIAELMKAFR